MKRKGVILAAAGVILLLTSIAFFGARADDVSKVSIGFAGYTIVDGKDSLIFTVTNGSSRAISQPGDAYELRGESSDRSVTNSVMILSTSCSFEAPKWGWQWTPPKVSCIAPGATFRFTVPVDEQSYTWQITVPFSTIPFKDRLPFALRSRWPSTKHDIPISFRVSSPPIPPAPSQFLSTTSVMESGKTPL